VRETLHRHSTQAAVLIFDENGDFVSTGTLLARTVAVVCRSAVGQRGKLYVATADNHYPHTTNRNLQRFLEGFVDASSRNLGLRTVKYGVRSLVAIRARAISGLLPVPKTPS
jgi:hypothetical protein